MKSESADCRAKNLSKMYDEECAGLLLCSVEEQEQELLGRYYLRREKDHCYWSEVVVLRGGSLLVHGDVDTVMFTHCSGMQSAREVVHWMARSDYGYATEKAAIGGSIARCFEPEVALWEVLQFRRQKMLTKDQARELTEFLEVGVSQYEFSAQVYELTSDPELCSMGMVTDSRVLMACAVLRRLKQILAERDDVGRRNKASRCYTEKFYFAPVQGDPKHKTGSG